MSDSVLEELEIQLADGPSPVYRGGEVIKGKIHIRLRKQITVFAVRLQIKGRAVCLSEKTKSENVEKVYFDQDMALLERPPGKPDPHHFTWIANFDYNLPFEMPLPKGCPTSFESPFGFIRYFIKASLVEEDGKELREYFVKNAFSIVAPSDGHVVRGQSASVSDSVMYGKCCCKGKVTASLDIARTGYLPGESVFANLRINDKKPQNFLNQNAQKGAKSFEKAELFLLTIPPVPPTTQGISTTSENLFSGDFENITDDMHKSPKIGLYESPSTATLRFRRIPFLRIEYAIQVTLANSLLLEVPIQIGELKTLDHATVLRPFVAGAMPIEESDENGKIAFNGPFTYTPMYPFSDQHSNGSVSPLNKKVHYEEKDIRDLEVEPGATTTSHPDTHTTVQTTVVQTELPDGSTKTETQTTTTITSEPVLLEKIQEIAEVNERSPSPQLAEQQESSPSSYLHPTIPSIVETPPDLPPRESPEPPVDVDRTVSTVENDEGVTTTTTEIFTEDGITTTRVTTVTRHPDGSETTHVREESTAEREIITGHREHPTPSDFEQPDAQEGDETYTQTETFEDEGVTTIRTTTVTKHPDGSETRRVREESHEQLDS